MWYYLVYFLSKFISLLFFPVKRIGIENIPKTGPFILASNHISYLDPVVLGTSTGRRLTFMARDSLYDNKILGFILPKLWAYPIKRKSADMSALKLAIKNLKSGLPVLLFPEGTRKSEQKSNHQPGIGLIAIKSGAPVIPVFIQGTLDVLPPGAKFFKRRLVVIRYGRPITFQPTRDYQNVADRIMLEVQALASQAGNK